MIPRYDIGMRGVLVTVVALGCMSATAFGQPSSEALFREGRELLAANRLVEACAKFEAALAIDNQLGPRLNLGLCNERRLRFTAALEAFELAEVQAEAAGDVELQKLAHTRAESLRSRMPRVVVRVPTQVPGLQIVVRRPTAADLTIDVDTPAMLDPTNPDDPADHIQIYATAPGYESFESGPRVLAERAVLEINLVLTKQGSAAVVTKVVTTRPRSTLGYVLLGTGAASLASSLVYSTLQMRSAREASCIIDEACVDGHNGNVKTWGNVMLGGGVALLAVGAYFAFVHSTETKQRVLIPSVAPGQVGVTWVGVFGD